MLGYGYKNKKGGSCWCGACAGVEESCDTGAYFGVDGGAGIHRSKILWRGKIAFPIMAALVSDSCVVIEQVDTSHTQGDEAIADVLRSVGGDLELDSDSKTLTVRGGSKSRVSKPEKDWVGERLAVDTADGGAGELRVNCSGYPDAVCALAAIACYIGGITIIEDIAVCRRKETDRIKVMTSELLKLGADIEEGEDFLVIRGHSPLLADGSANPEFALHGGTVESFHDHRVAMSCACLGLGLPVGEELIVKDGECCSVSFPGFVEVMNSIGAGFR